MTAPDGHAFPPRQAVDETRASTVDVSAVAQLVLRERQSRDRGWWDRWSGCFAEDSVIDMSWFSGSGAEFIRQTQLRSQGGVWGRHRLSPPAVLVNGDRAWAELPLGIEFQITVGGVDADLTSYCRSQYQARRTDDAAWRITGITSIYERDCLTPSIPGTTLDLDPAEFAMYRPSYRCLAWYLGQNGTDVPSDLLGDDKPETVARHYQAQHAWLNSISATTADLHAIKEQ